MPGDDADGLERVVERAYRLILGRQADPDGADGYLRALRAGEVSVADVCASLASSDEFAQRLVPAGQGPGAQSESGDVNPVESDPAWVDVAELLESTSVAELAERAERYFQSVDNPSTLLAKPLGNARETPDLLVTFGQVLRALRPLPGMTVLDFGAGTCWTSRFLTQLGCRVIAMDVSRTALEFGKQLFDELPVLGEHAEPEFVVFDGYHFDLPDASVDRVLCFDALHHVPNPDEVVREMARVLKPGGVAAFSEPGHRHSAQPQSQYEMRNYGILENDVLIDEIWKWAQEAGFAQLKLCLFDASPHWVDIQTFHDVVSGHGGDTFLDHTRRAIDDRRMFWLRRDGVELPDSRVADALVGTLAMEDVEHLESESGTTVTGTCRVHNPGPRTWLSSDADFGSVSLGIRLHLADHTTRDLTRVPIPGQGVQPGQGASVPVNVEIPPQPEGIVSVEFDLVSEDVCWFSVNGSPVVQLPVRSSA